MFHKALYLDLFYFWPHLIHSHGWEDLHTNKINIFHLLQTPMREKYKNHNKILTYVWQKTIDAFKTIAMATRQNAAMVVRLPLANRTRFRLSSAVLSFAQSFQIVKSAQALFQLRHVLLLFPLKNRSMEIQLGRFFYQYFER